MFQSPQWGSNSKDTRPDNAVTYNEFQSPQWGSNSKDVQEKYKGFALEFQSPQWGSNSKVMKLVNLVSIWY